MAATLLTSALAVIGCVPAPPTDTAETPQLPLVPASGVKPSNTETSGSDASASVGLQPLPTPQQVTGSVPLGRRDPFAQPIPSFSPGSTRPDGSPALRESGQAATSLQRGPTQAASLQSGRVDLGSRTPPPLQLPPGFGITGVIRSGGITEAVVRYGPLSGSLRPGDRGGRTTDLLPSGWSVAAVDVNQGLLTLQKDGRRVEARL